MLGALRPALPLTSPPGLNYFLERFALQLASPPANLVAPASSCSASPGNSSICQKRNDTPNFRIISFISYLLVSTSITLVSHRPKDSRTLGYLDEDQFHNQFSSLMWMKGGHLDS